VVGLDVSDLLRSGMPPASVQAGTSRVTTAITASWIVVAFGFAGVCDFASRGWRCWLVFWPLRWHPRFVFVLHAVPSVRDGTCFVCDGWLVCSFFRWHPRFAFALQASPLCGAAPTFLCRRKEK
jgi:hypothetical protein